MQSREVFVVQVRIMRFEVVSQSCTDAKDQIEQYIDTHDVDLCEEVAVQSDWFVMNVHSLDSNDARVYGATMYPMPIMSTNR